VTSERATDADADADADADPDPDPDATDRPPARDPAVDADATTPGRAADPDPVPDGGDPTPTHSPSPSPDADLDAPVVTEREPDVVVLRQTIHGQAGALLHAELVDRLVDRDVAVARTPAEEARFLETARVAVGPRLTADDLDAAPNLRLFACTYAGVGHLDLDAYRERGVAVTNASGVHAPNVSEYVVGGLIAQLRQFGRARDQAARAEWRKYPVGELAGSTVCVLGQGAIGTALVERLVAFDVETVAVRHTPAKGGPADAIYGYDDLHEALSLSDHVVAACPLTDVTEGIVDREAFRTMGPDAILVNVARGPVVDTDALVRALRTEGIAGAVLDVTDPEPLPPDHALWTLGNVLLTPHNAGNTPRYFERLAGILARNLTRVDDAGGFDAVALGSVGDDGVGDATDATDETDPTVALENRVV
jgi:phosphoglycerate dehydrogenase-like enzyme